MRKLSYLLLGFVIACSTVSSDRVATNQISASVDVDVYTQVPGLTTGEGAGTKVEVKLNSDEGNVTLAAGDTLSGKSDKGADLSFKPEEFLGTHSYVARFPGLDSKTVSVSFKRANGTSAPSSTVMLPAALSLTTPLPNTMTYSASLKVAWTNKLAGAKMTYRTFPCGGVGTTEFDSDEMSDEGEREFTGADLAGKTPPASPMCLKLELKRKIVEGNVDPAFKKGSVSATRHDIYDITVTP
ncbi:MAG: hypothetical protein U0174_15700 [Polyangiaceae bacterium]